MLPRATKTRNAGSCGLLLSCNTRFRVVPLNAVRTNLVQTISVGAVEEFVRVLAHVCLTQHTTYVHGTGGKCHAIQNSLEIVDVAQQNYTLQKHDSPAGTALSTSALHRCHTTGQSWIGHRWHSTGPNPHCCTWSCHQRPHLGGCLSDNPAKVPADKSPCITQDTSLIH